MTINYVYKTVYNDDTGRKESVPVGIIENEEDLKYFALNDIFDSLIEEFLNNQTYYYYIEEKIMEKVASIYPELLENYEKLGRELKEYVLLPKPKFSGLKHQEIENIKKEKPYQDYLINQEKYIELQKKVREHEFIELVKNYADNYAIEFRENFNPEENEDFIKYVGKKLDEILIDYKIVKKEFLPVVNKKRNLNILLQLEQSKEQPELPVKPKGPAGGKPSPEYLTAKEQYDEKMRVYEKKKSHGQKFFEFFDEIKIIEDVLRY